MLALAVNKLGDPSKTIASNALHLLSQVTFLFLDIASETADITICQKKYSYMQCIRITVLFATVWGVQLQASGTVLSYSVTLDIFLLGLC